MKNKQRWLRCALASAITATFGLIPFSAFSAAPFVVKDIKVEGLQRTEVGTVFTYLPVRVGETFDDEKAAAAIRALFATGFFKDVKLEVDNGVLVVIVEERPAIGVIELTGVKEFDKEVLKKALADNGLAESRIFDKSTLDRAEQELKRQYLSRGFFNATVTTTIAPLERNRVAVTIAVTEGETTRIASMRIVGGKAFSEKTLLDQFNLTTPTWLSWYLKTDQYSKEKLTADLETLRSFYLDRGYFEFSVESSQVSISPDKSGVFVSVTINEGEAFKVGEIKVAGDTLGREENLKALIGLKEGQPFVGSQLSLSTKKLTEYLGELGYAFANIQPVPVVDREKKIVGFNFLIDPGRRVYVRKINITGNQRTRDEVIRREMRQFESAWYDGERVRISRERIDRLGYFKNVEVETRAVGDAADQIDILINVVEKPSSNVSFGVGFSTADKVSLSFGLNQENFLGTGKTLAAKLNTSKASRSISVSYLEPYFTDAGISRSFDVYSNKTDARQLNLGDYSSKSTGIGLRFGIPYTEIDRVFFGLTYDGINLSTGPASPQRLLDQVAVYGQKSAAIIANLGWLRDSRDSALAPTRGRSQSLNLDLTLPVLQQRYVKIAYIDQLYYPINKDITLGLSGDLSFGSGYGSRPYPVFKNLYAGGIGSVRAFDNNSLGPQYANGDPVGGRNRIQTSAELIFGLPGTGNDKTIRGFLFLDAGNVFAGKIDFSALRVSSGVGLSWLSPIGAMKLTYGLPLKQQKADPANGIIGDRIQRFQFQVGTGF